jgi:ATP-binding cassette subfamily F protein 3
MLISHDRDFLDATVSHIAHIEQGRITLYSGNYSAFERIRSERLAQQQAAYDKQQREIHHIQGFVDRFRAKATKARQAQSRLKALERMERIAPAHVDSPFHFEFPPPDKNPNPLLSLDHAIMGYDECRILEVERLVINAGDRIGLLGHNGAGKSTLIRSLAEEQPLLQGQRDTAQDLKLGYFAQHQLEQLHPEHSPLDHLLQLDPRQSEQALRDFLGGFGFMGDRASEPTAPFSGGEKARLVLALLVYQRPNLLLLDEPTNHLDLEMRQALAVALQSYEGAMVLVSHDRHLLRSTADQLWLVHEGAVSDFPESVDDYPRWIAQQQALSVEGTTTVRSQHNAADKRERKRQEAERRKQLQPLSRKQRALEGKQEQLSLLQKGIEEKLADMDLYSEQRKNELKAILADKVSIDQQLAEVEEAWMEITEAIESMQCDLDAS